MKSMTANRIGLTWLSWAGWADATMMTFVICMAHAIIAALLSGFLLLLLLFSIANVREKKKTKAKQRDKQKKRVV